MLLTVAIIAGAYFFDAPNSGWALTMVSALAIILFVESFAISFHRHPQTWRTIRWILLIIILALFLMGYR